MKNIYILCFLYFITAYGSLDILKKGMAAIEQGETKITWLCADMDCNNMDMFFDNADLKNMLNFLIKNWFKVGDDKLLEYKIEYTEKSKFIKKQLPIWFIKFYEKIKRNNKHKWLTQYKKEAQALMKVIYPGPHGEAFRQAIFDFNTDKAGKMFMTQQQMKDMQSSKRGYSSCIRYLIFVFNMINAKMYGPKMSILGPPGYTNIYKGKDQRTLPEGIYCPVEPNFTERPQPGDAIIYDVRNKVDKGNGIVFEPGYFYHVCFLDHIEVVEPGKEEIWHTVDGGKTYAERRQYTTYIENLNAGGNFKLRGWMDMAAFIDAYWN